MNIMGTGAVVRNVAVGAAPIALAADGATGRVFVLNEFSNTVSVLDMRP